jgi:choline/carnitine/betaine transport
MEKTEEILKLDKPTFAISGGFLCIFIIFALFSTENLSAMVNAGFGWSIKYFGAYWQLLLLATFIIGLFLAISNKGDVVLGNIEKPELTRFSWTAIIMCTLLAGGGVFWAAAEPIAHFAFPPPLYGDAEPLQKAINALSQSFMHWGFLAWAILGILSSIVLTHLHYDKGLPLKPRTLLYPIFGDKVITGPWGAIIDGASIIAVAAGTIGPIGFLGLQVSHSLNHLFELPNNFFMQALVIVLAVLVYIFSAISGVNKGIKLLSRYNVMLAVGLICFILIFGPTQFIINGYVEGVGTMITNFIPMATFRADEGWLGWWTVFFWGWFMGYGPMMAIFITRISRGRTIRDLIITISILAPLITMFWFSIVGGSGLYFEILNPGSITEAFKGFNLPATLLAITTQFPLGYLISILFLILTSIFIITTGDSMTYTISVVTSNSTQPDSRVRIFWGILMGTMAILLISLGSGGISALQSFIVITAVPVSLILLPSLWNSINIANQMKKDQSL